MKLFKILALAATTLGAMSSSALTQDKISMWSRSTSEAFMPGLIKAFNEKHETQIELQIVPSSEMVQKYATAAAGGSAPDFVSLDLVYAPAFAKSGALEDLTDMAKSLPYFEHLSTAHIGTGTYDGTHLRAADLGRRVGASLEQETVQAGRP